MEIRFDGRVALITGGGNGIGREVALVLANSGADIAITDLDRQSGEETAQLVRAEGRECLVIEADVSIPADCERAVDETVRKFGRLDIQINNAGISKPTPSIEMSPDLWNRIISIDLSGVFFSSQAAARQMFKQGGGVIISLASMSGALGFPGRAPYCAAKAGVISLTQTLGCEWASQNIRVNAVAPGYVMTALVERNVASGAVNLDTVNQRTPLGRVASPREVANVIAMLASDYASYVTGETVYIDGGWTAYGGW